MSIDRKAIRKAHHLRVRRKVSGTAERPRLCVYRSLKHISAQPVDDTAQRTLCAASTLEAGVREGLTSLDNAEASKRVGTQIAQRAREKGIEKVVFDRSGYLYHGRVKVIADAAREAGLQF